jgi:ssDNA-specific exonuclease RecJ
MYYLEVRKMRYLITIDTPQEFANQLTKNPKESAKMLRQLVAQLKPEALYFSTTRRHGVLVVDVKDPHSELRSITENLSQMGQLTVDPVSTTEEFLRWMESLPERK